MENLALTKTSLFSTSEEVVLLLVVGVCLLGSGSGLDVKKIKVAIVAISIATGSNTFILK